jgi:hypothetical protein
MLLCRVRKIRTKCIFADAISPELPSEITFVISSGSLSRAVDT